MPTITQSGYDFIYRQKVQGQPPIIETWDIERVAAFMFLIEFYRVRSQRYVGSYTFVSAVGNIQYELEGFDVDTNRDLDKLTKLLLPYTSDELCIMWYTSFKKALDMADRMIKDKIREAQEPYEVFGQLVTPPPLLTRPSREEYERRAAEEKARIQAALDAAVPGAIIKVTFEDWGPLNCKVLRESPCYLWVDGYQGIKKVVENARIRKGSSRILAD